MENIITASNDDLIGYYHDLKQYLEKSVAEAIKNDELASADDIVETLTEMLPYKNSFKLLRISNNNGMGITVRELEVE